MLEAFYFVIILLYLKKKALINYFNQSILINYMGPKVFFLFVVVKQ